MSNVINIETKIIKWSVHTPGYKFPWVNLDLVDFSSVLKEGKTLERHNQNQSLYPSNLWKIDEDGKGQYKTRLLTEEELFDPEKERENRLRQLRDEISKEIREVLQESIEDQDLKEIIKETGVLNFSDVIGKEDLLKPILDDYRIRKQTIVNEDKDQRQEQKKGIV